MICYTFLLSIIPCIIATYPKQADVAGCRPCEAYGVSRRPNSEFTHRDGCYEYNCYCECSGAWKCPSERTKDICSSEDECSTCWAGNEVRQPNRPFQFTEDCYQYDCFCACDGGWNCPKEKTKDICNTNVTTGCYYCTVGGERHEGNSQFKFVNGCIEYECFCKCDGGWNCPGERAVDRCNTNPDTGCYYCEVKGKRYDGNSYFSYKNGCIEYNCVCNCDGSWNCPGEKAKDLCRQNQTTGCYYCEVDGYLFQGNSRFDLVRDCYRYTGCNCACDGGWTCSHTFGEYICNITGFEISECKTCVVDNKHYRGNSMFALERECLKYICTCDCRGNYYCPAENARVTCPDYDVDFGYLASLSSGVLDEHEHTRAPRQVAVDTRCSKCIVSGNQEYSAGDRFTRVIGCNRFECTCYCNGTYKCPAERTVDICSGSSRGVSGGGSGLSATSAGSRITAISRGSAVDTYDVDSSVSVCRNCQYLGVTYQGNAPFTFEKGCFKYNCQCYCNGSFNCPSERTEYICEGREECVRCDLTDYNAGYKEPNTNFQIRRGCDLFEKCRCNCDGGWSCEDGVYACDLETGCVADGRRIASDTAFELTRGCDRYKDCYCYPDGRWSCEGRNVEDLCGECRKCKIGDQYFDGDTSFEATVNCTRYRQCTCKCDGSYECRGGRYVCDRSDQPPECTDCVLDGRKYRNGQSFDYTSGCVKGRGCECRCGTVTCRESEDTCGDCRSCNVDGVEYAGGSTFKHKQGCYEYSRCECNCNGRWECFGDSAKDVCNKCRKCNVDGTLYDPYSNFNLQRNCWNYQCFCLCNGTTWCPSATVVNTCQQPDTCRTCEVEGREIRGNTHFNYKLNGMDMHCRCNCNGSYVCVAEWLYVRQDVSISGTGIGSGLDRCFTCIMDGRTYQGDTSFSITRSGIDMKCECYCSGGYFCYGEKTFPFRGCYGCQVYGRSYDGSTSFPIVFNGLKLSCQCSCDGSYICYGSSGETVISCIGSSGCLPTSCGQCVVDGVRFNGFDQFGTVYRGQNLRCDCGCDGSYYCEGSGGIIVSCVRGQCRELGCSACEVYGQRHEGGSAFELYYKGLKLSCQCECGGNYQCFGSNREIIVSCIDGSGCLTGACAPCFVQNRQYNGLSVFNFDYNGIAMRCVCACDGSYYCEGVYEQIQISCVGGVCTRLGCSSCNVYGIAYEGDSSFELIYQGLKLKCQCSCDSGYICTGSSSSVAIVTCVGGRGIGCLPATCRACVVNNREYAGRSTFRSVYKGIDVMCTCGCDGSSFCSGISTSIEISCIGGTCTRIGCRECSIFGREYMGGSTFDMIYKGLPVKCDCDCDGGYICTGSDGVRVLICVNGVGPGCLIQSCGQCIVDNKRYDGGSTFNTVYQGIDMACSCSCDSSYYCEGVREEVEISCIGGKCNLIGCRTCNVYGEEYDAASKFNIVHLGLLMDCQCACDGSYKCYGESGTLIIQCIDGRGTCLDRTCSRCEMDGRMYTSGSSFRYNYQGIDVTCTCGCDGSVFCVGMSTDIKISCVGGKCTPIGCQNCVGFAERYAALSTFNIIHSGYRLNCRCECSGGIYCEGEITLDCRGDNIRNCFGDRCNTCSLNGRQYRAGSTFKYLYNGIDVSCDCGCDGSVFCVGVTERIEIRCIGGSCNPIGCRTCSVLGREVQAFQTVDVVHNGIRLTCSCGCDSGLVCLDSSGKKTFECFPGRPCFPDPCRECVVDGRRYSAGSKFPHRYRNIGMNCDCGCDGTAFCEGVEEIIYVSCIGGSCSQVGCRNCNLFGQEYQGDSSFDIIYKGDTLDCQCNCDSSYRCNGSSTGELLTCPADERCTPSRCRKCRVNGRRYDGGTRFEMDYKGNRVFCRCGCDGSYWCQGVTVDIIISCQRKGGCKQIGGCSSCTFFGKEYGGGTQTEFVYQGYFVKCYCQCDSSFRCLGTRNETIIECRPGQRDCFPSNCGTCNINGKEFAGNTQFDHVINGKDMRCTCGCDGSYYCRCKDDDSEVSCNRGGTCTWFGCNTCLSDGRQRDPYERFEKIYDGIRMNCQCACDGSYRCAGIDRIIVIICNGESCRVQGCRSCLVDGQEYQSDSSWEVRRGSTVQRCTCRCDGTTQCETITRPACTDCVIDGQRQTGHSRNRVYRGSVPYICDCYCNGTHNCYPERQTCGQCEIGGRRYDGRTTFETVLEGTRVQCTCDCDGTFVCRNDFIVCRSGTGCVSNCRQCNIDGQSFAGNNTFQADVFGSRMQCTCHCNGDYECRSEYRICTSASGCVDQCAQCLIDGQRFNGNANFPANVYGQRMQCECDCQGNWVCRSDSRICRNSGCQDICKQCVIDRQTFQGDSTFEANVFGGRMQCTCDCQGGFTCRSETRTCTLSGCTDNCRQCVIDRQTFRGDSTFEANVFGGRMQCTCDCQGGFTCRSETRTCTLSGCTDNCRQCVIDRQTFQGDSTFEANVFGGRMQCTCDCKGGFTCRSETRTCTLSGCADNCRQCVIDRQTFRGDSTFEANVFGGRMQCTCDCKGGFTCRSETRTCTLSGCTDNCRQCVIDNQRFQGNQRFQANVYGGQMECTCDCTGSWTCVGRSKTCTSARGCYETCKECTLNGKTYPGNSQFDALLEGTRMSCTCDCRGNFDCSGGGFRCSSEQGCISTCSGCEIEGRMYAGNTKFEIFHRGYGINMACECQCGGSYRCNGTTVVDGCYGTGCTDNGCRECDINGVRYSGNTQFETIIDGTRMQCTCFCNGGYKCEGTRTETSCYGPSCPLKDAQCSNCVIRGKIYAGNTQFEFISDEGVRLRCTCDCEGKYSCRGEKTTAICIGPQCGNYSGEKTCTNCIHEGREYRNGSSFQTVRDGVRMDCICACNGEVRCEGSRVITCEGPDCITGCKRCVIDGNPYTGNTRFVFRKGSLDYNCVCYCDGSYSCRSSTGVETSCVGESCASDKCRSCMLFDREYQLDARFRLQKNNLIMNCVCECDGAYRCWSISGTCTGPECDEYGCKSCAAEGQLFPANTEFELSTGMICTCQCNGEYKCRAKSLGIKCVGEDCGVGGDGCKKCIIDGDEYPGNRRFQIRKYGLFMQCACHCDSSYMCRGYQIISEGESNVITGCKACVIGGRRYNGNTRFQTIIDGDRKVCSCDCNGRHSCADEDTGCRDCVVGGTRYVSNKEFTLTRNGNSIRCRCDCNGNFVCEGRGECRGNDCLMDGCRDCVIFGVKYRGDSRFTTDAGGIRMLCDCMCTGEYSCKGYRQVTNVILPARVETTCNTCFVAGTERPGNSRFTIQRACFQIECICGCNGTWECPDQVPKYICQGQVPDLGTGSRSILQQRYSIAGSRVYTSGNVIREGSDSTVIFADEKATSTVFGDSGVCSPCYINEQEYAGGTGFVLQDGCLRWTCACDCSGGYNCSAVVGSECDGPLAPFEPKQCIECLAYGKRYPPNRQFIVDDECYRYTCMCECDGSWECPRQLTVNTCGDSSDLYDPVKGTCRQCIIGQNAYNYGDTFDLVDNCINYKCQCRCNGSYFCPASTGVRVCRSGSGTNGRVVTTGSNTVAQTGRTVVALRPAGYGSRGKYSSSSSVGYTTNGGDSGAASSYEYSASRGAESFSSSSRSSFSSGSSSSSSSESVYRIQAGGTNGDIGSDTDQSGESYSYTSGSHSSSGSDGQVDLLSVFSGGQCRDCIVDGKSLRGGRDFTYRSGCIEYLCECFCNGTHYCDPEEQVNFCEEDRTRHANAEPKGCTIGSRTYKTKLFSYEKDCKKYYCRCYDNGVYHCDPNKTRTIC